MTSASLWFALIFGVRLDGLIGRTSEGRHDAILAAARYSERLNFLPSKV